MRKSIVLNAEMQAQLLRLKCLARHVWQHFREDRCFEEAASLGYTSLLAMVPLLAVIFGIVAAFPVFADWSANLKSFIFSNFMPSASEQLENYLQTFLASVSSLTLPGTVFLIITALLLMFRIEVAFNRIWRVDRSRTLTNRVVMYWAVLTLGPLLIGSAIALSAQSFINPILEQNEFAPVWHRLGALLLSWTVFTLIFYLVPHRPVMFRHALVGALLSTLLYELAKLGFVAYISNANYAVIYGALATIPIFLFWLYLVWVVVLLGASLAASLTTYDDTERARGEWPESRNFQLLFRVVGHLWHAQLEGGKLSDTQLLAMQPKAGDRQLQGLLHDLETSRIVARDDEGEWRLARDLHELSFADLYRSGQYHLPVPSEELPVESPWDSEFATALTEIYHRGTKELERPLRPMYGKINEGESKE